MYLCRKTFHSQPNGGGGGGDAEDLEIKDFMHEIARGYTYDY